jgi:hypothetical protein
MYFDFQALTVVWFVVAKPDASRVDWALVGSFAAPIVHQTILRFARN